MDVLRPERLRERAAGRVGRPLDGHRARGEAGAEGHDHDVVTDLDPTRIDRLGQGDRDRGGRRVAVLVQVHEHLVHRQAETVGHRLDDPDVGLVRDEQVDVRGLETGLGHRRERGRGEGPGGEAIGLAPLHPDEMLAAPDGLRRRRALCATGRQPDHVGTLRLGGELDAEPAAGLGRRRQDDRAGPVAEQDAGVPVGVVEEPGEQLGADHEDVAGHPAGDVGLGHGVGVDEAGAGRRDVHREGLGVADRLLDQRRGRRHPVVRGERRQQDDVDVVGLQPGHCDGLLPRHGRHRCSRLVGRRDTSLADPGPGADPFVGRVDHLLEVGVGQDAGRGVAPPTGDVGVARSLGAHSGSTSISGCLALTSDPVSATTFTTRPARSLLISLNSFIASIRPMTWPTATSPPT